MVDVHDLKDPGGMLIRYKRVWAYQQQRFHSRALTKLQILKLQEVGDHTTLYQANMPLGKKKVRKVRVREAKNKVRKVRVKGKMGNCFAKLDLGKPVKAN